MPSDSMVKLVPVQRKKKPNFGFARGQVEIADDFDEIPEGFEDYI